VRGAATAAGGRERGHQQQRADAHGELHELNPFSA
jgi:hypothetical protein